MSSHGNTRLARLTAFLATLVYRLPFNQWVTARGSRAFSLIQPRKIWPGNQENGDRLTKGHFRFAGKQIDMASSTWYPLEVDRDWISRLHTFNWLDDLRASSDLSARTTARALTLRWIEDHRRYKAISWEPVTLATRLTQWLANFDFLSTTADPSLQRALLRSATQQYGYLTTQVPGNLRGTGLIRALKALIIVGYCLPRCGQHIARATALLETALEEQIAQDGSHMEGHPATAMRLLLDLLDIRAVFSLAGVAPPAFVSSALARLAGHIRLLQHGDGRLAYFHGEPHLSAKLIQEALERADGGITPPPRPTATGAGLAGIYRLKAGRSLLLVDVSAPFEERAEQGYLPFGSLGRHASALAFEFSIGIARLITNCGNFDLGKDWKLLQRATAAHSTLVWDDRNSAEILPDGGLGRQPTASMIRAGAGQGFKYLHLSHDGYVPIGGGTHYRSLWLRDDGLILNGEDRLEGAQSGSPLLRFHLSPLIKAERTQGGRAALLRIGARELGWRFEVRGGSLQIAESVVADAHGQPSRAQQLIIAPAYEGLAPEDRAMRWMFYQEGVKP